MDYVTIWERVRRAQLLGRTMLTGLAVAVLVALGRLLLSGAGAAA